MPATEEWIVNQRSSAIYTGTMLDELGDPLELADLDTVTLTLYDLATGRIINGRDGQDVMNANDVSVHDTSGLVTWYIKPADNIIVGNIAEGELEVHVALFRWTWTGYGPYGQNWENNHEFRLKVRKRRIG